MALGRSHDKLNLFFGAILMGVLINFNQNLEELSLFALGFVFSTFFFSPDLDIGPKKRAKWLGLFLYPYSFFFKHRGMSHSILLGTLTRVTYLILIFFFVYLIFFRMGDVTKHPLDIFYGFKNFLINYNLEQRVYRNLTYLFGGMFVADIFHILVDKVSSLLKRIF